MGIPPSPRLLSWIVAAICILGAGRLEGAMFVVAVPPELDSVPVAAEMGMTSRVQPVVKPLGQGLRNADSVNRQGPGASAPASSLVSSAANAAGLGLLATFSYSPELQQTGTIPADGPVLLSAGFRMDLLRPA